MSVGFATRNSGKRKETDPNALFFAGAVRSALGPADLYLDNVSTNQKRMKTVSTLTQDQRRELALVTFPQEIEALRTKADCWYCGGEFSDDESLGRKLCAWHPGTVNSGAWTCCGDPVQLSSVDVKIRSGCSFCDHSAQPYDKVKRPMREMHYEVALHIGVPTACIKRIERSANGTIEATAMCLVEMCTSVKLPRSYRRRPVPVEVKVYNPYGFGALLNAIGL